MESYYGTETKYIVFNFFSGPYLHCIPTPTPILSHEEGASSAYRPWKTITESDSQGWEVQTSGRHEAWLRWCQEAHYIFKKGEWGNLPNSSVFLVSRPLPRQL